LQPANAIPTADAELSLVAQVGNGTYGKDKFPERSPFHPILDPRQIFQADECWNSIRESLKRFERDPVLIGDSYACDLRRNPKFWNMFSHAFKAAPMFGAHKDGRLNKAVVAIEEDYTQSELYKSHSDRQAYKSVSYQSLMTIRSGFSDDEILECFVAQFNENELQKRRADKYYQPMHMFGSRIMQELEGFLRDEDSEASCREKASALVSGRSTKRLTITDGAVSAKAVQCGMDLFGCRGIIFPVNEGYSVGSKSKAVSKGNHWTFFKADPTTLTMEYYCSLHNSGNSPRNQKRSKLIFEWLKYEHKIRHGQEHNLHNAKWERTLDHARLGTVTQIGVDCLFHVMGNCALLAEDRPVSTLCRGGGDSDGKRGCELRYRMMVGILTKTYMFQTNK